MNEELSLISRRLKLCDDTLRADPANTDAMFTKGVFLAKIREFRQAGKALVCVSHGIGMVRELCDRAIWLDHGELMMTGTVGDVLDAYVGSRSSVSTA